MSRIVGRNGQTIAPKAPTAITPSAARPNLLTPADIVNIVTRNAIPVFGVLVLHWSAPNVLLLYFADTLLSIGVMITGLALYFSRDTGTGPSLVASAIAAAIFLTTVLAIPLGMPIMILIFGSGGASVHDTLADRGFVTGLGMQAVASLVSLRELIFALRDHTPEELRIKRRFAIVFLRWACLIGLAMTPLVAIFGGFGVLVLVLAYAGLSIVTEINPTRFLVLMGDRDD